MDRTLRTPTTADRQRGFSLLELLIVVTIILIIATIAVPSLLRSRQAANEAAAAASLKAINVAQNVYLMSNHAFGSMDALIADGLLDDRFEDALTGYQFDVVLSGNQLDYSASATAVSDSTGRYDFYSVADFVIRYTSEATRAPVGLAGEPVQ
jgi:prepilin-type N-terminal cleavage/methylation domain-containing protein